MSNRHEGCLLAILNKVPNKDVAIVVAGTKS